MVRYLQDTNEYLSEKDFVNTFRGIAELDKEVFILLEKKVLEYEKEKKRAERLKRKEQEILNIQKEIEKSVRE